MAKFSVIIPTLNEARTIRDCIRRVRQLDNSSEIIVVDAGSSDKTVKIAQQENVLIIRSRAGRAIQLNEGAQRATSGILLFLHADTRLPRDAFWLIEELFHDSRVHIATFRLSFDRNNLILKFFAFFTRFESIITTFGSQCIVVRKSFFDTLGGFPENILCEDMHFLRQARKKTRICKFPSRVITSARKFNTNGIIRQQWRSILLVSRCILGATSVRLPHRNRRIS